MIKKSLFFGILFSVLSVMGYSQTKTDTDKAKPVRVKLQKAKIQPKRVSEFKDSKTVKPQKAKLPENNSEATESKKHK